MLFVKLFTCSVVGGGEGLLFLSLERFLRLSLEGDLEDDERLDLDEDLLLELERDLDPEDDLELERECERDFDDFPTGLLISNTIELTFLD